eukprot:Amastigsp_a509118_60.p2 type:complete len:538 gc:universal Amastigsp_a509118_60:1664-51(-)
MGSTAAIEPLKLKSDAPLSELMRLVSEADGLPAERHRLWACTLRENGTLRVGKYLPRSIWTQDLRTHVTLFRGTNTLKVFVQELAEGESDEIPAGGSLVALKYFNPATKSLRFVGLHFIDAATRVQDLFPVVNAAVGNPVGTPLLAVEEVTPKRVEELPADRVFSERGVSASADIIGTGDIVVFQAAAIPEGVEYPTVESYLRWLESRLRVTFKDLKKPEEDGVTIDLVSGLDYDAVTAALGEKLGAPGPNIRLTQMDVYTRKPRYYPLSRVYPTYPATNRLYKIDEMLATYSTYAQKMSDVLFYEVLDVSLADLESKTKVEFEYYSASGKSISKHSMLVDKNGTVADLMTTFKATLEGDEKPNLRLIEISNHKLSKILGPAEPIRMITTYYSYRVEVIPADDIVAVTPPEGGWPVGTTPPRATFINHYARNVYHTFGDPFVVFLRDGETLASLKTRIKARFELDDAAMTAWRFVLVSFNTTTPIEDEAPVLPRSVWQSDWVGIKHEGMGADEVMKLTAPTTTGRYAHVEKAIKISG